MEIILKGNNQLGLEKFLGFLFSSLPTLSWIGCPACWRGREGTPCPYLVPAPDLQPDCSLLPADCVHICMCVLSHRSVPSALCSLYQLSVLLSIHPAGMGTQECHPFSLAEGFLMPGKNFEGGSGGT